MGMSHFIINLNESHYKKLKIHTVYNETDLENICGLNISLKKNSNFLQKSFWKNLKNLKKNLISFMVNQLERAKSKSLLNSQTFQLNSLEMNMEKLFQTVFPEHVPKLKN